MGKMDVYRRRLKQHFLGSPNRTISGLIRGEQRRGANVRGYQENNQTPGGRTMNGPDHIIFAVHGIHTGTNNWADPFQRWAALHSPKIAIEECDYGQVTAFQLRLCGWIPFLARRRFNQLAAFVREALQEYPEGTPYSFVGHSWGTWLVHGMLDRHHDIKPKSVVLIGSVLREEWKKTSFSKILERKQFMRMFVLFSKGDSVIERLSFYPYGKLGWLGFIDEKPDCIEQLCVEESHGSYFSVSRRLIYFPLIEKFITRS